MKFNETLKELFVADNKLTPSDGVQLGSLLKTNQTLALLDLRNNLLQVGCDKAVSCYITAAEIFHIQSGPKKLYLSFNFAITSVNIHRF